jgi:hypothetical protein
MKRCPAPFLAGKTYGHGMALYNDEVTIGEGRLKKPGHEKVTVGFAYADGFVSVPISFPALVQTRNVCWRQQRRVFCEMSLASKAKFAHASINLSREITS